MRAIFFLVVLTLSTGAHANFFSQKKAATDAEGNCVPALLAENVRLYSEIEALDQIATRAETQLKSTLKESQKLGFESIKEIGTKAKASRLAIKAFSGTYGNATCKAQIVKPGQKNPEVITFSVTNRAAELDKLAASYEKFSEEFLRSHLAKK